MWHQWFNRNFYEATRIVCVCNKNKNHNFIQQFVSSASPYSAILESITYVNNKCNVCTRIRCLRSDQSVNNVNNISAYGAADTEQHTLFTCVILSKMPPGWGGGDELLNKVDIFVFFAHKKYSRSFVKITVWTTDVTWIILTISLLRFWAWSCLDPWEGQRAPGIQQKYLNLCSKMNEGLTGLEQHEGE